MNTDQRRLLRNACYLFAGAAGLFVVFSALSFDLGPGIAGLFTVVVLIFAGKFIWAGRPVGHLQSLGKDLAEVDRATRRADGDR
jgi:hypothetical protein